jgi:hypothetical protein
MSTKEFFKKYKISFIISIIIVIVSWIWVISKVESVCTDSIPPICSSPYDFLIPIFILGLIVWIIFFSISFLFYKLKNK